MNTFLSLVQYCYVMDSMVTANNFNPRIPAIDVPVRSYGNERETIILNILYVNRTNCHNFIVE